MPNDDLAGDIKNSIKNMQSQMQDTYSELGNINITGESHDKTVRIKVAYVNSNGVFVKLGRI